MNLKDYSLGEVSDMFRYGRITRDEALDYVEKWNASGKHFTVARVYSFSIGNK